MMDKRNVPSKLRSSKFLRTVGFPANILYRAMLLRKFKYSEDSVYLKSIKGKYNGKRCFVIGNGPSLLASDLDKLASEYTFATNKIYRIYDATRWRPSFYMCLDNNVIDAQIGNIKTSGEYPKFINYKAKKYGRTEKDNIHYLCAKGRFRIDPHAPQSESLSEDLSQYYAYVHTVTVNAIELAIFLGFKEIYLLGVDNTYANTIGQDGKAHANKNVADYFQGAGSDEENQKDRPVVHISSYNHSYVLAKKFAEEHDVKVCNATRGGKLEVFERVDFDKLMQKEQREEEK